jgi:hypothetical protein
MTTQEIRSEVVNKVIGYNSLMNSIEKINANQENTKKEFDLFLSKLEAGREFGNYFFNDEGFSYTLNNNKLVIIKDNKEFNGEEFLDAIFQINKRIEAATEELHDKKQCVCCNQFESEEDMSYSDFSDGFVCSNCIEGGRYVYAVDLEDLIPICQTVYTTDSWEYYYNDTLVYKTEDTNRYFKECDELYYCEDLCEFYQYNTGEAK